MSGEFDRYLQPSMLCDFDRCLSIRQMAYGTASRSADREETYAVLRDLVKEMPYGLENWDVAASETLRKGWGMCSAKTNLLVALLRSAGIPARYRVYRIFTESELWLSIASEPGLAERLGPAPSEQDHVDCEVWLGEWVHCDPARDSALEQGMAALGVPLERQPAAVDDGETTPLLVENLDNWAFDRQRRRRFREDRSLLFDLVNREFERIRRAGWEGVVR